MLEDLEAQQNLSQQLEDLNIRMTSLVDDYESKKTLDLIKVKQSQTQAKMFLDKLSSHSESENDASEEIKASIQYPSVAMLLSDIKQLAMKRVELAKKKKNVEPILQKCYQKNQVDFLNYIFFD